MILLESFMRMLVEKIFGKKPVKKTTSRKRVVKKPVTRKTSTRKTIKKS
jgi:hypothetical protein